jgi:hypothetical protein
MKYNLKDKIEVTEEYLNELISKSWQEAESIQQQIANIDTSTQLGAEVVRLLNNTCTNYYVLIGCLESLAEGNMPKPAVEITNKVNPMQDATELEIPQDSLSIDYLPVDTRNGSVENDTDFEPFEYFVDFDEPSGEPLSDEDIYG